ncbi:hypothetical protein YWH7199_06540 [Fusobacterium nucleatum YWH7199]|uniref:glycosyltransferase family 39 protein n=1 Tax=Fusobacterium nucleatum TaxID=851 RepID=UPI00201AB60B|nr:glycosyltransferase family 39 protein [Fusobacterium nucleatum]MCL4581090.1 hypothetical protein [Fusobacterium nucleatum YWH7199]
MRSEEIFHKNIVQRLIYLLLLLLFLIRIINIEADIPQTYLVDYSSTDEGIYGNLALNLQNWGSLMHPLKMSGITLEQNLQIILDIIGNTVIYVFMFIFGDNYYGFRLGIVFVALLTLIFIVLSIKKLKENYGINHHYFEILTLLFLDINFIFYSASRVVEPTIFRLFFSSIIIYIYISVKRNSLRSFLIGLFTTISIFLVYINNTFLILGIVIYILILLFMKQKKEAIQNMIYGLVGVITGILLSEIYYLAVWDTEAFKNLFEVIKSFNSDINYTIVAANTKVSYTFYLLIYLKRVIKFFSSNLFFYSLPAFSLVIASLYNLKKFFKEEKKDYFFCLSMIVALFIQTLVSEDFINRKSIVLLPFIIYICINYIILYQRKEVSLSLYNVGEISFLILCIVIQKIYLPFSGYAGFNTNDKVIVILYILIPTIIFLLSFSMRWSYKFLISMFLVFCLGNMLFIYRYYFRNIYFYDKEMMISLDKYGNQIILGEYINGYTLYNNIRTLPITREETKKLMDTGNFYYYFDYSDVQNWLDIEFGKKRLKLVVEYPRSTFNQFGNSNMGIYRIWEKPKTIWDFRKLKK